MRDRPHAEIPDSSEDNDRDSDAPTQLWSGRLSLASITPRLRAARHRQRLEALLNTQTGITFDAAAELPDVQPQPTHKEVKISQRASTSPPVVSASPNSTSLSGPQLALFIAVGVAVGGIAALHMDHVLHPFARHAKELGTEHQSTQQAPTLAANGRDTQLAAEDSHRVEEANVHVATAPAHPARVTAPKLRSATADAPMPAQVNPPVAAAAPVVPSEPQSAQGTTDLRIPTQLHPRINPLMTSNQVFRDE